MLTFLSALLVSDCVGRKGAIAPKLCLPPNTKPHGGSSLNQYLKETFLFYLYFLAPLAALDPHIGQFPRDGENGQNVAF